MQDLLQYIMLRAISIHALRGEDDRTDTDTEYLNNNFNPRPPWGGRHGEDDRKSNQQNISIHALRGEDDCSNDERKR